MIRSAPNAAISLKKRTFNPFLQVLIMMFLRYRNFLIINLLAVVLFSGCSASRYARRADKSFEIGEYYSSIKKNQKASRKEKDAKKKLKYDSKIADAYWHIGDYRKAGMKYRNLVMKNYPDSLSLFRYAEYLRYEEKYDEATEFYKKNLEKFPDDDRTIKALDAIETSKKWAEKPSRFEISKERQLNSRNADYSPSFVAGLDNNILFTSTRDGSTGKRKSAITGQRNGDIFRSSFDVQRQRWERPEKVGEDNVVNSTHDEGVSTLTSDGSQMFFTRCQFDKRKAFGAQIMMSTNSRESWSEAVSINLLSDSLVAAHPSISNNGQVLYFVSDMDGGYGGLDIWMVEKSGDSWGKPVNMGGVINTPGNEVFPYIRDNGELYFSSDYHPGFGGLDIFKAVYVQKEGEQSNWVVENMQLPINSRGDDFGITFLPKKDQGMFSSNRKGSMGDDLYSFVLPPIIYKAEGRVINNQSDLRENNVFVRIIGTDGTNLKMRSNDGKFQFRLQPNTEYIFAAFKDGFLNAKKVISTKELDNSTTFDISLAITPTDVPVNVDNIVYEFGKYELLPSSKTSLDSLSDLLKMNPTIVVEIMSHTDHVGTLEFNSTLSQKRAQSVVDYLIEKGINSKRLVAKGYGETWPKKVTSKIAKQYDFLKKGDELTESFINKLDTPEQKDIAQGFNRRTEFRVLRSDFVE